MSAGRELYFGGIMCQCHTDNSPTRAPNLSRCPLASVIKRTGQTSPLDWATLALLCATIFPLNLLSHLSEVGALDIIIIILRVAAREKLSSFLPMRTTREPCKELDESAAFRAQLSQSSSEVKCGAVD